MSDHSVLIHGKYGNGNFGDDLISNLIESTVKSMDQFDRDWQPRVVSPARFAVRRPRSWSRVLTWRQDSNAAMRVGAAILGGGGYVNDASGSGQLQKFARIVNEWSRTGIPFSAIGVGVGPLTLSDSRQYARDMLENAQDVSVRDVESKNILYSCGLDRNKISVTSDWAHLLTKSSLPLRHREEASRFLNIHLQGERVIGLHLQGISRSPDVLREIIRGMEGTLSRYPDFGVLLLTDTVGSKSLKRATTKEIRAIDPQGRIAEYRYDGQPWALAALLNKVDAVITTKLHVGIVAWVLGVPPCAYARHEKTRRFYTQIGREQFHTKFGDSAKYVTDWIEMFASGDSSFATEYRGARGSLQSGAQKNRDLVRRLLQLASRAT